MGDVNVIDSDCVGELVGAFVTTRNRGAQFKLLDLTKNVNQVLNTPKLLTVFESFKDESTALKSFSDAN